MSSRWGGVGVVYRGKRGGGRMESMRKYLVEPLHQPDNMKGCPSMVNDKNAMKGDLGMRHCPPSDPSHLASLI